jgi:hypothetical protein
MYFLQLPDYNPLTGVNTNKHGKFPFLSLNRLPLHLNTKEASLLKELKRMSSKFFM